MKIGFEIIKYDYEHLKLEHTERDMLKENGIDEIVYKSKDLLGMQGKLVEDTKDKTKIKSINGQHQKLLNVFLQTLHNTLFNYNDRGENKYKFYTKSSDSEDFIYIKMDLKDLVFKLGNYSKTKTTAKDMRFLKDFIHSMQSMYVVYDIEDGVSVSTNYFNRIEVNLNTEEIYVSFKDEIVKPLLNNYNLSVLPNGKDGYITVPITKYATTNINNYAMMLYEYISCNIYNCTHNNTPHDLEYLFSFMNNDNYKKFSQKFERVFLPAISSLEDDMGLKVFYVFEKTISGKSIKNVRLKVYKTKNYVKSEKSEALDLHIQEIEVIKGNRNIFNLNELILLDSINNLDSVQDDFNICNEVNWED